MRQRCRVSCVIGASNWYWLTVGQGLLPLQQVQVEGECFNFFTFIHFPPSLISLSFISSTIFSISLLPFSGRWHKMTHKGWRVIKPQHNQSAEDFTRGVINDACAIFFLIVFIKAYVVGTHLNCLDLSRQFKWVLTTHAFIKKQVKIQSCNLKTTKLLDCVLIRVFSS